MKTTSLLLALVAAVLGFVIGGLRGNSENRLSAQTPERAQVVIDDTKAVAAYANFCRVTGTPEEVILDYGLNPKPFGTPAQGIPVSHRIVMNFYTAKRMLHALEVTIQRHEATFGALETDVQKRVKVRGNGPNPSSPKEPEAGK